MLVREFTPADKEAFFELCKMFYQTNSTLHEYDEKLAKKTFSRILDRHENLWGYMFVDKDTLSPIGYALVTSYWCNEEGGDVIVLDEIYLDPVNRHKGYAAIFMKWLEEHFSDACAITLEVIESNRRARDFYERAGFVPDGYITYTKKILNKDVI